MPNTTLLINLALPANDKFLVAHKCTFANILPTSPLHSILVRLLAVMGTPKYFSGRLLSYNPVISRHCYWIICEQPPNTTWDFARLALSPTQSWNSLRAFIICCNDAGCALLNRMRSSTNIRCVSPSCLQF